MEDLKSYMRILTNSVILNQFSDTEKKLRASQLFT